MPSATDYLTTAFNPKPGDIYPGMPNDFYHNSNGISKTKLDLFANDQSSLEWAKNCPVDKEKLKTLDFGDAAHAICLEPDRLKNDFFVLPKLDCRKTKDKEKKAELLKENAGKKLITAEEYKKLTLMFDSVMAHPFARKLIESPGISEQSYYWTDPDTGILCKCRPDRAMSESPILVDIKTTDLLKNFRYSIQDYRYYVQDPFYMDGVNACGEERETFVFLVIQKTIELGRYPVKNFCLSQRAIDHGRETYKRNLHEYAEAIENNQFDGIYEAELPYSLEQEINGY